MRGLKPTLQIEEFRKPIILQNKLTVGEENGLYVVESSLRGIGYCLDDGHLAIATSNGWIKMSEETAVTVAKEMLDIVQDMEDLRRMQCR